MTVAAGSCLLTELASVKSWSRFENVARSSNTAARRAEVGLNWFGRPPPAEHKRDLNTVTYASLSCSGLNSGPNISASALFLDFYAFPCGSGQMWPDTHVHKQSVQQKKKKERQTLNIQFRHIYRLVSKRGCCVSLCSRDCSKDIIIKTVISQDFLWIFNMFCWLLNILIVFSAIFYFIIYIYYMAKYVSAKPQMTWNFTLILIDICVLSAVVNPPLVEKKDPIQRSENATFCPKKQF